MTIRFATHEETLNWNDLIVENPDGGNIFQGIEFSKQKQSSGWTPRYVISDDIAMTVLEKYVFCIGRVWYIPKGPGVNTIAQLSTILSNLRGFAQKQGVFLIKIEPELLDESESRKDLLKLTLIKSTPIQPNTHTVNVDISPSQDEIIKNFNQKGRHAIRRAERDGVTVIRVDSNEQNCKTMYNLLTGTADGSFRIRSFDYYKSFWQRYATNSTGQLFFASVDGQVVAGAYAMTLGTKSTYKDGASIKERTVYGASHLLQWEVMQWAKENGALTHDLCGTPSSANIKDASDAYYGLGRFKTSFNKHVTDYIGVWDLVISPVRYKLWSTIGQRIVLRLHSLRHSENWW